MFRPRFSTLQRFALALLAGAGFNAPAQATWSIAAINPRTGTIAVTAASCSEGVYGIQAVLPGKGVVIVQASSNGDARAAALKMLDEGVPLDTILARISDPASGYSPERQQYVLLSSGDDARPRTYTGADVPGAKGAMSKDRLSVQANIMVSDEVVARTFAALARTDWPNDLAMARALMQAMNAGAKAGGDRRCGKAASSTAFIGLYRKTDPDGKPWVELSVRGVDIERDSGTAQLNVLFRDWLRNGIAKRSTRTFIVP